MFKSVLFAFSLLSCLGWSGALVSGGSREAAQLAAAEDEAEARAALESALLQAGIQLDIENGICSVPARVLVRDELLEFLLVGPRGSAHESLFVTEVQPSLLNTAMLTLGVEPGQNVQYVVAEPEANAEGTQPDRGGVNRALNVVVPSGDGFYLYLLWKEANEVYLHRIEDLIRNLKTGRTMRRHEWVYLGSRFAEVEVGKPEQFLADREGNLINIAFFGEGNTLLTAALTDCREQTIWIANSWMLPERGWPVNFILSRKPLIKVPDEWVEELTEPNTQAPDERGSEEQ